MQTNDLLHRLFQAGVRAVRGDTAVANALDSTPCPAPDQIIAVGKAATAMARAAAAHFGPVPMLIVTKYHHAEGAPPHAEVIEAAHPVLDENSLRAGRRLRETVGAMPTGSHLLMLVSGGASALAEDPVDGMDLDGLTARARDMLASGADIHAMNAARRKLSRVKGGALFDDFSGARVTTLAISDVEGDALSVIGSGIGDARPGAPFDFVPRIVASNSIARAAVAAEAARQTIPVIANDETLYDDVNSVAAKLGAYLRDAAPGLHLFGGEPTVVLPENPGQGGRNQALGLLLARETAGTAGLGILVAGTDGTDGPTDAAGAVVSGQTWAASGQDALDRADAGPWLADRDALLKTGPTGTNVMDLVIAVKA
ncbi:DUF4147 domain-containing protein [uncultured Roseobacter sp.]|uniref:DUF4147 domain-containing protein n=1 Tax=uncultured Roseobacter sp. TaxID=114847 RepID=UPI002624D850|nr:DUF4147 domain-containing protein [uncultured Roseobacter sp.]